MTSLNNLLFDDQELKDPREVLIELPQPAKPLGDDCTIVMNGLHSYGPATAPCDTDQPKGLANGDATSCQKPDAMASSADEEESDAGVEESSIHLLQADKEDTPSVKCLKGRPRLPSFKSSPSKKSSDAHSHIQHQPLGVASDAKPEYEPWDVRGWGLPKRVCFALGVCVALGIVGLLVGVYVAGAGECPRSDAWWDSNVVYEIFPASFQDSDGDGFGDLRGIIQRLDYVRNLSVDVVRLNSVFSALDYPLEYEHVIDFGNVDPHLGRMEDLEDLVREVHDRGMFLILDINPTVTSDQHTWAAHWLLGIPGRYEDYYVNVTDEKEDPPLESNPVYTDDEWPPPRRPFGSHYVLNWSHALVQLEVRNAMDVWLSLGVDGFYVKHVDDMRVADPVHYLTAMHQWRYLLDRYSVNTTRKVLMMSQPDVEFLHAALGPARFSLVRDMVDVVDAGVRLAPAANGSRAGDVGADVDAVREFWRRFPTSPAVVWHAGSAETLRTSGEVHGRPDNMAAFFLLAVLPGSFSCFYGDEIGLQNSVHLDKNKVYRGGQFTPMQWTAGPQANFTSEDSDPWIPVHPSHAVRNVLTEQQSLRVFRTLVAMKRGRQIYPPGGAEEPLAQRLAARLAHAFLDDTQYQWYHNPCGLVVVKTSKGDSVYAYIGNFGPRALSFADEEECVGGSFVFSVYPWRQLEVILATSGVLEGTAELQQLLLEPGDAVVGRLVT